MDQSLVALYVTSRGLSSSPIPYGEKTFQIDFDFVDHRLLIRVSDGALRTLELRPRSVASFYTELLARLQELGLEVKISRKPNEVIDPIPFDEDLEHASYDAEYAHRFWLTLVQSARVFQKFRARFIGKCSPVHFFWGACDLAVTRFSGRRAPMHAGGMPNLPDRVVRDAYSHEVSSCGFWPGGGTTPYPLYFAYAYPEPEGFRAATELPSAASYDSTLGEFILPYEELRRSSVPDSVLLDFLQGTYEVAANLGAWDRSQLEY